MSSTCYRILFHEKLTSARMDFSKLAVKSKSLKWEHSYDILTHICLMDFPILVNWTSPFFINRVSGVFFLFLSYF